MGTGYDPVLVCGSRPRAESVGPHGGLVGIRATGAGALASRGGLVGVRATGAGALASRGGLVDVRASGAGG
jgi:hypothetical protein